MVTILRIGGSVIASSRNPKPVIQYADLLRKLKVKKRGVIAVVGGGKLARQFINLGRKLGLDEVSQDWLAIHISRLYALLLTLKLGKDGIGVVPTSIEEAIKMSRADKIVVMGGLEPGMTTDTVAARLAEETSSRLLVKATDRSGIYNKDPARYPDAVKLAEVSYGKLSEILEINQHEAGIQQILDPVAIGILSEAGVKTVVVDGKYPENILRAIAGERLGTTVTT